LSLLTALLLASTLVTGPRPFGLARCASDAESLDEVSAAAFADRLPEPSLADGVSGPGFARESSDVWLSEPGFARESSDVWLTDGRPEPDLVESPRELVAWDDLSELAVPEEESERAGLDGPGEVAFTDGLSEPGLADELPAPLFGEELSEPVRGGLAEGLLSDELSELGLADEPSEPALDELSERGVDGPSEPALDEPSERGLDESSERALDESSEPDLDEPSEPVLPDELSDAGFTEPPVARSLAWPEAAPVWRDASAAARVCESDPFAAGAEAELSDRLPSSAPTWATGSSARARAAIKPRAILRISHLIRGPARSLPPNSVWCSRCAARIRRRWRNG
jgi:hypothetical protein